MCSRRRHVTVRSIGVAENSFGRDGILAPNREIAIGIMREVEVRPGSSASLSQTQNPRPRKRPSAGAHSAM